MSSRFAVRAIAIPAMVACLVPVAAQQSPFNSHDDHTEYQLLAPDSHQFHIVYHLSQRQVGATTVLNQTRSGSEGSDISVRDPRTGQPLKFEYKTGADLTAAGEQGRLTPNEHYIRAFLPRPVPEGGEGRVRIEKTYRDEKSYYTQGADVVFARSLGIGRNAIVLPTGYGLVSSNVAGQVMRLPDGRVKVAFENVNTYAADVVIRGRPGSASAAADLPVVDRAFDFAKTLYDLGDPATHQMSVRYEYVESAPGARARLTFLDRHRLQNPTVTDMDTGAQLKVVLEGTARVALLEMPITSATETAHLRIAGTEEDSAYRVNAGQLEWARTLHEPRTTILLPAGWDLTAVSTPATISTTREGRIAIYVINPRLEPAALALRATRRPDPN